MRILIFSDIHADLRRLRILLDSPADAYVCAGDLSEFTRGLREAAQMLAACGRPVYLLPGNHETASEISSVCAEFGLHDFHGRRAEWAGYSVAAIGYSSPTPFRTPGEYTEAQLAVELERLADPLPRVLVCHAPPLNTRLDRAGPGRHFGSSAVRAFLDRIQPDYFFCGHIHEAQGVEERIGTTLGVNVGKKGFLLELNGERS